MNLITKYVTKYFTFAHDFFQTAKSLFRVDFSSFVRSCLKRRLHYYPTLHSSSWHFNAGKAKMSGTERKSWSEVLPLLFNLLVENADRIVDDTSLERILEWLKNVCETDRELQKLLQCGTVEFISREQVFSNPESSGFFLRLFGFLVAKAELFRSFSCAQDGDFLSRFLDKPKSEPGLWNEGIVRHGYFQALISLTEHEDGVAWLRIGGSRREPLVHPASMSGPIIINHEIF